MLPGRHSPRRHSHLAQLRTRPSKLPFIAHRGPVLLRNEPPPRAALLKAASSRLSNTEAASVVSSLGVARGLVLPLSRRIEEGQGAFIARLDPRLEPLQLGAAWCIMVPHEP